MLWLPEAAKFDGEHFNATATEPLSLCVSAIFVGCRQVLSYVTVRGLSDGARGATQRIAGGLIACREQFVEAVSLLCCCGIVRVTENIYPLCVPRFRVSAIH